MGVRKPVTRNKQRAFIAAYAACASTRKAGEIVGVDTRRHYEWMAEDKDYRIAFEARMEEAGQTLEDEAVRRAYEGVKRPMYYRGKPVKTGKGTGARQVYEVEYSDTLLLALLKRFRPALYREHVQTEVSGSIDIIQRLEAGRLRVAEMRAKEQAG